MNYRRTGALRGGCCGGRATDGRPDFRRTVQSAFLAGLAGASGFRERQWRLIRGGRGRVDLAVEVDGDEQMLVIIEQAVQVAWYDDVDWQL